MTPCIWVFPRNAGPPTRRLLQNASVTGQVFDQKVLVGEAIFRGQDSSATLALVRFEIILGLHYTIVLGLLTSTHTEILLLRNQLNIPRSSRPADADKFTKLAIFSIMDFLPLEVLNLVLNRCSNGSA